MRDVAVRVENVSKRYLIDHEAAPYGLARESLTNLVRSPINRLRGRLVTHEWIWALRDISFDIERGTVVGVIGRNGSGKSTLLKILSRITEPTSGMATLRGRVGSLLEVGTGFHPELTGRENVFMSGAVLGMRRVEIVQRFDEIVDFAGIEQFLDTPVKRYSTGMQVRLGFAVAAHLEPEILFIDEVLAVGDADFQKKCLNKMTELGAVGRTILFVSHSLPAVLRLCQRAMLLDHGRLVVLGPTSDVVRHYLEADLGHTSERRWDDPSTAPGNGIARLRAIRVVPADGGPGDEVDIRQALNIEVEYWTSGTALRPMLTIDAFNEEGICIFGLTDQSSKGWNDLPSRPGRIRSVCHIPGNFLAEGRISLNVAIVTLNPRIGHAVQLDAVAFQVADRSEGDGVRGGFTGTWPGVVRPMFDWTIEWEPDEARRPIG
jgi:lipopolysaccharide transport system ATP-binding protein